MNWAWDDSDGTSAPTPSSGAVDRQGAGFVTTFIYDPIANQFIFPVDITGSGMTAGHDYILTVYLRNHDDVVVKDALENDAEFLLHVAHP